MFGQGSLGELTVGQPEEFVSSTPIPALALVTLTVNVEVVTTIQITTVLEEIS